MDLDNIWHETLKIVNSELNLLAFQTWFENTNLNSIVNNIASIVVPLSIHKQHMENNYKDLIINALKQTTGEYYTLNFILESDIDETQNIEIKEDKKETQDTIVSNLNPRYNFESFVVGNSNRFAQAAALAVAENPGKIYNPLFIYGNSGLGKTHLMHAIGNYIKDNSDKKVLYITSEQFINDYVAINRRDDKDENFEYVDLFKSKYRDIDVLIIDDIQYLGGATETQKEFFQTFNSLHENKKQIIISSDSSPNDLKRLEDRLITRFSWGLTVDIFPPDYELRYEILNKKIIGESIGSKIPNDVIEFVAFSVSGNVRALEGALNRLLAYATIMNTDIDIETAKEALKDFINKGTSEKNDITKIQRIVANYFSLSVEDLKSKKRKKEIILPRQIAMYLSRKHTDESFPKIGSEFGGKDHSTVIHSCDKIEKESKKNKELKNIIEKLEKEI